jgi:hypothetical protein
MKIPVLATLAALGLGCGVALAEPPTVNERMAVDDTIVVPAGELCAFPVTVHQVGTARIKVQGDRLFSNPNITDTVSGPGGSVTSKDVGLDRFSDNGDGTFTIHSTGIHFQADGVRQIGLQVITILASTGELVDLVVKNPTTSPDSAICTLID